MTPPSHRRKQRDDVLQLASLSRGLLEVKADFFVRNGQFELACEAFRLLSQRFTEESWLPQWRQVFRDWFLAALAKRQTPVLDRLISFTPWPFSQAFHLELLLLRALQERPGSLQALWAENLAVVAGLPQDVRRKVADRLLADHVFTLVELPRVQLGEPLCQQIECARAAFAAFETRRWSECRRLLRRIPFDSPARDFCLLLKLAMSTPNPELCRRVKQKLAPDSPFWPLWQPLTLKHRPLPSSSEFESWPVAAQRIAATCVDLSQPDLIWILQLRDASGDGPRQSRLLADIQPRIDRTHGDRRARIKRYALTCSHEPGAALADSRLWCDFEYEYLAIQARRYEASHEYFEAAKLWLKVADSFSPAAAITAARFVARAVELLLEMEKSGFDCRSFGFDGAQLAWSCIQRHPEEAFFWLLLCDWYLVVGEGPGGRGGRTPRLTDLLDRIASEKSSDVALLRRGWQLAQQASFDDRLRLGQLLLAIEPLAAGVRAQLAEECRLAVLAADAPEQRTHWWSRLSELAATPLDSALLLLYRSMLEPDPDEPETTQSNSLAAFVTTLNNRMDLIQFLNHLSRLSDEAIQHKWGAVAYQRLRQRLNQLDDLQAVLENLTTLACFRWSPHFAERLAQDVGERVLGRITSEALRFTLAHKAFSLEWFALAERILAEPRSDETAEWLLLRAQLFQVQSRCKPPDQLLAALDDALFEAVAHNRVTLAAEIENYFAQLEGAKYFVEEE